MGILVQLVNNQSASYVTGTTAIPFDDTIPQNTEGTELITLAITPTNASNKLKIDVVVNIAVNATNGYPIVALFQDSTADALAAMTDHQPTTDKLTQVCFTHYMTAGTTSETTFKVRYGDPTGATAKVNGETGALFNGCLFSSITIREISA